MFNHLETVLALLPFLAFLGCWMAFWRRSRDWRESFLIAATLWGVWTIDATELLSLGSHLTRDALTTAWLLACILAWTFAIARPHSQESLSLQSNVPAKSSTAEKEQLSRSDWLLLTTLCTILLLLAIVAFFAPPDTWDAMQYNMPRVVMWIQNRSVHFYPTVDYQQLTMSPWAEYAMTNLTLLAGSDRLVNFVEWFAFLGSIIGVSLIAQELGAGARGQILAAVFCGTIPQAVLAGTSAKPDVAVGFWIVASCYFLIRYKSQPGLNMALLAGAALGLAFMTKGTAYPLIPAFVLAILWMWPAPARKSFLVRVPIIGLIVLLLNGPQFYRNFALSGSPLGFASPDGDADTEGRRHFANGKLGVRDIAGNLLRSIALHVETPNNRINAWSTQRFRRLISAIGVDPDDQRMIEQGNSGEIYTFRVPRASRMEVLAGNFLHFLLFILALILLLLFRRPGQRNTVILAFGAIAAFVLFCAAIRWQPYNGRFHLPAFMIACAVIGAVLVSRIPRWGVLTIAALALLGALPYALSNEMRPLLGIRYFHGLRSDRTPTIFSTARERLYFGDQHLYLADSYLAAVHAVAASGCREIGLDAFVLHYDYPMLALLRAGMGGPNVRYVHVRNRSASYEHGSSAVPCALICLGCAPVTQKWQEYSGPGITPVQFDREIVFFKAPFKPPLIASTQIPALKFAALPTLEPTGSDPVQVDTRICNSLSASDVQGVVGALATPEMNGPSCRYKGAIGEMQVSAYPTDSYYSRDFATLAAEGMGSLQVHEKDYDATVVLDQGSAALMYLHKGNLTYSVNIDRQSPPPTANEYTHLAGLLAADAP